MMKLDFKSNGNEEDLKQTNTISWTGSKVSLIELMYALQQTGSFNHGQTDIKSIAQYFENVFNIELGNYYRTYLELRIRQNPTKFLETLQDNLLRKM